MKNLNQLKQELKELKEALAAKSISTNEYSTMYYNVSQKIQKLK
jgi:hypothetical protein